MAPMIVMGLFGFIGKAVKGIGKVVGGVAKLGLGVAKFGLQSGLLPIPGGGLAGKLAGTLLAAKRPMSSPTLVASRLPTAILRAKSPMPVLQRTAAGTLRATSTARLQQMSPVLPGGAIATRYGPTVATGAPPVSYSGGASPTRKRRRKKSSRARSSKKRTGRKRKLKFGSPAWRKKYLGSGRRKRRKRAA